jgi:KaiC/GvpD/RAD55 family RecA-like ATPase
MRFGIPKLDELVGEVEPGRVLLLETAGELGREFVFKFLQTAEKSGENIFIFVPERMVQDVGTWLENPTVIHPEKGINVHELFTISLALRNIETKIGGFLLLDSLIILHPPDNVFQLFRELTEVVRKREQLMVITLDKSLVDEKTLAMFEEESDYVIELREIADGFRLKKGIRVKKSPLKPPSDFYELIINGEKIDVGDRYV